MLSFDHIQDQIQQGKLVAFFAGGCGEFGANLTVYCYGSKKIAVDCGLMFSEPHKLGVEYVIPNIDALLERLGGLDAYVLTHGHEDHIGALPHFVRKWPAPIFGSAWTLKLVKEKLARFPRATSADLNEVEEGKIVDLSPVTIKYFPVNHSIPMTCCLLIETPAANVFHTGDFKFDQNSLYEGGVTGESFSTLSKKQIDLLVCDSTNATQKGSGPGEASIVPEIEKVILSAKGRIYFSTFSSNYWRLKTVLDICSKHSVKVLALGAGVRKTLEIASSVSFQLPNSDIFIDEDDAKRYQGRMVIIVSGCQGEPRSTLRRLVMEESSDFSVRSGDTLVLSARTIPGNERPILALIDRCTKIGVHVIQASRDVPIHVSGHAYQEEILSLAKALKAKHFIPVHGTFTHMLANKKLIETQLPQTKCVDVENGSIVAIDKQSVTKLGQFELSKDYVDSWSLVPMSHEVLRQRLKIGDSGMALVSGIYDLSRKTWVEPLAIQTFGLTFTDEKTVAKLSDIANSELAELVAKNKQAIENGFCEASNEQIGKALRRELTRIFVKKPVVIPKIGFVGRV
ncbi:MAG: ribonuclease J [Oligoflexales bacterium]